MLRRSKPCNMNNIENKVAVQEISGPQSKSQVLTPFFLVCVCVGIDCGPLPGQPPTGGPPPLPR